MMQPEPHLLAFPEGLFCAKVYADGKFIVQVGRGLSARYANGRNEPPTEHSMEYIFHICPSGWVHPITVTAPPIDLAFCMEQNIMNAIFSGIAEVYDEAPTYIVAQIHSDLHGDYQNSAALSDGQRELLTRNIPALRAAGKMHQE